MIKQFSILQSDRVEGHSKNEAEKAAWKQGRQEWKNMLLALPFAAHENSLTGSVRQ